MASWRGGGVRRDITVLTLVSIVGPLLLGIGVLAVLLHRSLTGSLVDQATGRAYDVSRLLETHGLAEVRSEGKLFVPDGGALQVVDAADRIPYTSSHHTERPLTAARPAPGSTVVTGATVLPSLTEPAAPVIAARGAVRDGRHYTVIVLIGQAATHAAVSTIAQLLLAGLPVLLVAAGLLSWRMVGRALEPVVQVRRTVDEIGGHPRGQRVAVPQVDDEIGQLATTMNGMLERIDRAQSAQRRFIANASHELRSPVTSLRMAVELGGSTSDPAELQELWGLVDTESARMKELVEDLLMLSKTDDQGRAAGRLEEVDLDDVVAAEASRLATTSALAVRRAIEPARVLGDEGQLTRVVRNLADNAARASATTVSLTLVTDANGPTLRPSATLYVDDDGGGVPPADRERVFDRFVRLDDARSRAGGGSGLGLAIVRELVRAHGGDVWVTDAPLGGARFAVRLPLLEGWGYGVGGSAGTR